LCREKILSYSQKKERAHKSSIQKLKKSQLSREKGVHKSNKQNERQANCAGRRYSHSQKKKRANKSSKKIKKSQLFREK
jgi:hypothetical protein